MSHGPTVWASCSAPTVQFGTARSMPVRCRAYCDCHAVRASGQPLVGAGAGMFPLAAFQLIRSLPPPALFQQFGNGFGLLGVWAVTTAYGFLRYWLAFRLVGGR